MDKCLSEIPACATDMSTTGSADPAPLVPSLTLPRILVTACQAPHSMSSTTDVWVNARSTKSGGTVDVSASADTPNTMECVDSALEVPTRTQQVPHVCAPARMLFTFKIATYVLSAAPTPLPMLPKLSASARVDMWCKEMDASPP